MARLKVPSNTHAVSAHGYEFVAKDGHIDTGKAPPHVVEALVHAGSAHAPEEDVKAEAEEMGEQGAQARADEKRLLLERLDAAGRRVDRRTGIEALRSMVGELQE